MQEGDGENGLKQRNTIFSRSMRLEGEGKRIQSIEVELIASSFQLWLLCITRDSTLDSEDDDAASRRNVAVYTGWKSPRKLFFTSFDVYQENSYKFRCLTKALHQSSWFVGFQSFFFKKKNIQRCSGYYKPSNTTF